MKKKNELEILNPIELLFLQRHIKLGKGHLERLLTEEETEVLLRLATIPSETREKLATDAPELMASVALVLNTVMTASLGAWMGLSGFLELRLDSPKVFMGVFSFAVVVGALVGFQNARATKKAAQDAIEKRKLQDFEIAVLQEVIRHRRKELEEKTLELRSLFSRVGIEADVYQLEKGGNIHKTFLKWIERSPQEGALEIRHDLEIKAEREEMKKQERKQLDRVFEKLSHAVIHPSLELSSWIRSRSKMLFVQLIPTLLGGFSSLFVYLGGAPRLAGEMHLEGAVEFLLRPEVRAFQLTSSILITLYFGFSFVYLNLKSFKREKELSLMQAEIARRENVLDTLDDELFKMKEALVFIRKLDSP